MKLKIEDITVAYYPDPVIPNHHWSIEYRFNNEFNEFSVVENFSSKEEQVDRVKELINESND